MQGCEALLSQEPDVAIGRAERKARESLAKQTQSVLCRVWLPGGRGNRPSKRPCDMPRFSSTYKELKPMVREWVLVRVDPSRGKNSHCWEYLPKLRRDQSNL